MNVYQLYIPDNFAKRQLCNILNHMQFTWT